MHVGSTALKNKIKFKKTKRKHRFQKQTDQRHQNKAHLAVANAQIIVKTNLATG